MDNIEVVVQLYGAFRKYGGELILTMPAGCTAGSVKGKLADLLEPQDREILKSSAIANENEIMAEGDVLAGDCRLAVLPPVCGG
jgi:molybdopterin converting factor small subunit